MPFKLFSIFFLRRSPSFTVIDIGTTYFKIFLFDKNLKIVKQVKHKNKILKPQKDFREVNPTQWFFWSQDFLQDVSHYNIRAVGITGQRETTVFWDKNTGMAVTPAILWNDKRTRALSQILKNSVNPSEIRQQTGLFWHYRYPLFRLIWAQKHIEEVKNLKTKKRLCFGPPASWLIYNLSRQRKYIIDHTQASRTLLYNIHTCQWDSALTSLASLSPSELPKIVPNLYHLGDVNLKQKKIPIFCSMGDQEASLLHLDKQALKLTLSTGVFVGYKSEKFALKPKLETSVAFYSRKPVYLLEKRLSVMGKKLLSALKHNDHQTLSQFKNQLDQILALFPKRQIYVDGGLVREDKWGEKMKKELSGLSYEFHFCEGQTSSAKGVARMLSQRFCS